MNFSIILKDLMSRKGWNQEDLAKAGEQTTDSKSLFEWAYDSDANFCSKSL